MKLPHVQSIEQACAHGEGTPRTERGRRAWRGDAAHGDAHGEGTQLTGRGRHAREDEKGVRSSSLA